MGVFSKNKKPAASQPAPKGDSKGAGKKAKKPGIFAALKKDSQKAKNDATVEALTASDLRAQGVKAFQQFIAPSAVKITPNSLQIGKRFCRTMFVANFPRFVRTAWLAPIINLNRMHDISLFIHPADTTAVLKGLTSQLAKIQAQVSEREEKGLVRSPVLETALGDIERLRDSLQQGRERFFRLGIYITVYGNSEEEVEKLEKEIESILENRLIESRLATFQQQEGFNSTLPIVQDKLMINSQMNTGPISTSFPFVSADLSSNKGILYGINRHNNSLIIFDRFSLENANTVIFGKSGAGKSYTIKLEILRYMMLGSDVIVIDPENEYQYLAQTVGGAFLKISLTSEHHINPFDLPPVREGEDPKNILREAVVDLVNIMRIMLGGLSAEEDAIMDKAIREAYATRDITIDTPNFHEKTPPILKDLQDILYDLDGGKSLATKLEKYTTGRFEGFFNHQSNIDIEKELVVFNIRDMEEDLRPVAMYIILNYIWKRVRLKLKKRILFVDEAWWLLQHEESASFLFSIAKRARKYYLGLTTITQDVADFLRSRYGEPIITNSSLQLLFKQSPATIDVVQQTFNLTDEEKMILLQSSVGTGIFFAGLKHVAIQVVASYSEDQIITSDPEQILKIEEAKKQLAEEGAGTEQ